MEPQYLNVLIRLLSEMSAHLDDLVRELREVRKEHTALRQQAEKMQAAISYYVGTSH